MAVQAFPYLALTDGTVFVTLADGAGGIPNYPAQRGQWSPMVAALRTNYLGGRTDYEDVEEDILINMPGVSADAVYIALDTARRMLDQAERFYRRGEQVSRIVIQYAPQGSTLSSTASPLLALVMRGSIELVKDFNDVGMTQNVIGLRLRILRRGLWVTTASESAQSGTANNPIVLRAVWPSVQLNPCPTVIKIRDFTTAQVPTFPKSILLWGPDNSLALLAASSLSPGAPFASVSDAAANAYLNNILRYTPTDTAYHFTGFQNHGLSSKRLGIYAAIRNNSSTVSWRVQVDAQAFSPGLFAAGPEVVVDTASLNPRLFFLGDVSIGSLTGSLALGIAASSTAGSPTLDINYIAVIALDQPGSGSVEVASSRATGGLFTSTDGLALECNPLHTSDAHGRVSICSITAPNAGVGLCDYRGDPSPILAGGAINALWLACGGATANSWAYTVTGGNILQNILVASRQFGYLVPR